MLILFIAGSKTVQGATTNFITTMVHEPETYKRLREEVDPFMQRMQDNVMEKMTLEEVEDLEYVKMCYQEVLRRDAPAAVSKICSMTKTVQVSGVVPNPGDAFIIGTHFMQRDPKQWSSPESFIPQRFDPESPYYKRPDGGKRNTYAYSPFSGG